MDSLPQLLCKYCHQPVPPEDYFCPSCGKKFRDKPPATTASEQAKVYIVSLLFWPFGLVYIWRYLKQPEPKAKMIGWIVLALTVIMTVIVVWTTKGFIDEFKRQLNSTYGDLL